MNGAIESANIELLKQFKSLGLMSRNIPCEYSSIKEVGAIGKALLSLNESLGDESASEDEISNRIAIIKLLMNFKFDPFEEIFKQEGYSEYIIDIFFPKNIQQSIKYLQTFFDNIFRNGELLNEVCLILNEEYDIPVYEEDFDY